MPDVQRKLLPWGCFGGAGLIIVSILLWPALSRATNPAQLCTNAAQRAATAHQVPFSVLQTIALVETGRNRGGTVQPWPWAIHADGKGHWFDHRAAAVARAQDSINAGRRNVDLGCFQINYHWHGHRFASLDDMIDPARNADYAARLLAGHKARLGSWELAAGAYHSATPAFADRYMARFRSLYRSDAPIMAQHAANATPRTSLFPAEGTTRMGSLVPLGPAQQGARLIDLGPQRP